MNNYWFVFTFWCFLLVACQSENGQRSIDLPGGAKVTFLSLEQARQAIVQDEELHFFDQITPTDIEIQTKRPLPDSVGRSTYLADYKAFIQEDVQDFTTEDRDFLGTLLREIARVLHKIDPSLLDRDINLIKVGGRQYGPSVFYTRTDHIVIPAYELARRNPTVMRSILLHELFHIYSRYHPEQREALYAMIGFQPLGIRPEDLKMPDDLRSSLLLNPDGVDYTYAIELSDTLGNTYRCVLLTSSEFHQYSFNQTGYFPHLTVNFYPVEADATGGWVVQTTETGASPLNLSEVDDSLWAQIGGGTLYIIHPDEILADYFALLAGAYFTGEKQESELIDEMEQIISGE